MPIKCNSSSRIHVLPADLAQKIAAGEVVERPGSVVKELVENSIDAGASQIRVELTEGGARSITVFDNGLGIPKDEVLVALERHATSKLQKFEDLFELTTMGFRGEALPSIASVSRLTVETKSAADSGRMVYLEGGNLKKDGEIDLHHLFSETGTLIRVEDLFYNVPARLKFLKSKASEAAFIRELLERISLCNSHISFTLTADGRKSFSAGDSQKERTILSRVSEVFACKLDDIEHFESSFENISIEGFLDRNTRAPNSKQIYLSVNGRMVRDKLLQQAVLVALRPRMMEGEFPKVYLSVHVPPQEIDVNVHPTKIEVRFHRSKDVFQVIHGALNNLAQKVSKPFYNLRENKNSAESKEDTEYLQGVLLQDKKSTFRTKTDLSTVVPQVQAYAQKNIASTRAANAKTNLLTDIHASQNTDSIPNLENSPGFSNLQYIGQLKNTYLLFQDGDGLVLIDQHAAHERINYEKIKTKLLDSGLQSQPLLIPIPYKCSPEDLDLALENKDAFLRLGFEIENFGNQCLLLRSIPLGLGFEYHSTSQSNLAMDLFKSILTELSDQDLSKIIQSGSLSLSPKVERLVATSACHSSIRAGQPLSLSEVKNLVQQMDETPSSLNCPHGRPASIHLSFSQLENFFKR